MNLIGPDKLTGEQLIEIVKELSKYSDTLIVTWSTIVVGIYIYYHKEYLNYFMSKLTEYRNKINKFFHPGWYKNIKLFKKAPVTLEAASNYNELKGNKNSKVRIETLEEISKTRKHLIEILNSEFDRFFLKEILIVLKTYGNLSDEIRVRFKNKYLDLVEATLSAKEKTIFSQNFDSINTFKLFVINYYLDRLLSLELYLSLGFDAGENDITKSYRNFEIFKVLLDQKTNKEDNKNITELVENYFKEDK